MGNRHPYFHIRDEDEDREQQFRKDRKERVHQKKWIGSGEDGDSFRALKDFNEAVEYQ